MRPVKPYTKMGSDCLPNRAQSTGLVNDHLVSCFRHKECSR